MISVAGSGFQEDCQLYFEDTEDYVYTSRVDKLTYLSSNELLYVLNNNLDEGTWRVKAKNPDGQESSWFSFDVGVDITGQPIIEVQPTDQYVALGDAVTFSVEASGSMPLGYQWRLNGSNIPGATNSEYTVSNVQWTDVDSEYSVRGME